MSGLSLPIDGCSPVPATATPPVPAAVTAPPGSTWAVMFDPRARDAFTAAAELAGAKPLPGISIVLLPSDLSIPPKVPVAQGVVGSSPVDGLTTLLEGLNWMALIDQFGAAAATTELPPEAGRFVVGGTIPEDGYPELRPKDAYRPTGHVPGGLVTTPARMPVVNLSLAPENTYAFDPADPINFATWVMSGSQLCVFAAGNEGDGGGTVTTSPWALAPWVLSVGATEDLYGTRLAAYSSRGVRTDPDSGPDVVAFGTLTESDPPEVGTSFAAPLVTRWAVMSVILVLQLSRAIDTIRAQQPPRGIPLSGYGLVDADFMRSGYPGRDRFDVPATPILVLNSDALSATLKLLDDAGIALDVRPTPDRLRRITISSARPMPDYRQHEVGAGFVSFQGWFTFWESFSGATLAWLFADSLPPEPALRALSRLGLVPREAILNVEHIFELAPPVWAWDFATRQLAHRPASQVDGTCSPWVPIQTDN